MIRFLDKDLVIAIHNDEIYSYGGALGFLNESLLDSALSAPEFAMKYSESPPSLYDLAATYGCRICKNHAFQDGNKRTATAAMMVFLEGNGLRIIAHKDEILSKILAIESNEINEQQLADWLSSVTRKFP
jgi:death on curing protein